MVELVVTIAAVTLLALGVLPMLPGAPLSLARIYLYWWRSGFTDPGLAVLLGLTALGLLAIVAEYAGGAVSATFGGAARSTVLVATVIGIVALVLAGPLALIAEWPARSSVSSSTVTATRDGAREPPPTPSSACSPPRSSRYCSL